MTLYELFYSKKDLDETAYKEFVKGKWQHFSWSDIAARVASMQHYLASRGLSKGDKVAILLKNGTDWVVCEQAALGLGLIVVPLYVDDRASSIGYCVVHSEAKLLFIANEKHLQKISDALPEDLMVAILDQLDLIDQSDLALPNSKAEDLATIVYTSGTLGRPKGVMLSHKNIVSNAKAISKLYHFSSSDRFLSFLPLSHMLERTAGYYLPMLTGAVVCYARSVQTLGDDIRTQKPTILIAVPRVFERVLHKLNSKFAKSSSFVQLLWRKQLDLGYKRFKKRLKNPLDLIVLLLVDLIIARKIKQSLGGKLRLAVSGGAALNYDVSKAFLSLGIDLVQGYGLTESSPVISVNHPDTNIPRSVGLLLDGVEAKVGENSELLVRSDSVMMGYLKDTESTKQTIDNDGFLHTGDQVKLERNRLYITGRIKEILVLSNGEKIPPSEIESAIKSSDLVSEALVFGEGMSFIGAIIQPNSEITNFPDEKELLKIIDKLLADFPAYMRVRKIVVTNDEWSIENGMLTPTLKLKRDVILTKYAKAIEEIYR